MNPASIIMLSIGLAGIILYLARMLDNWYKKKLNEKNMEKLPEKWGVKTTKENLAVLENYRINQPNCDKSYVLNTNQYLISDKGIDKSYCLYTSTLHKGYTEISFDDFKRLVLKEESIPEYVECTETLVDKFNSYQKGKIYRIENKYIIGGEILPGSMIGSVNHKQCFKPSTKEAYEAQFKPKETELVVGNWYEYLYDKKWTYIFKFTKLISGKAGCDIFMSNVDGLFKRTEKKETIICSPKDCKPANMEEVYQYFPEERPKEKETMEKGNIYVASNGNIFRWGGRDSDYYINIYDGAKEFQNRPGCFPKTDNRLANKEESEWLNACITANKFIPKEEALKSTEFKVGDWVITANYSGKYNGKALKITKINGNYCYFEPNLESDHNFSKNQILRLATSEEIAKVTEEVMFKKGDTVVVTDFGRAAKSTSFDLGRPYVLKKDFTLENGFIVEEDNKGSKGNGWSNAFDMGIKLAHYKEKSMNTYGLKVGDIVKESILKEWSLASKNTKYTGDWEQDPGGRSWWFPGSERKIDYFEEYNSVVGIHFSGKVPSFLIKAEGFKEFMDNFDKPKTVEPMKQELTSLPEKWCIKTISEKDNPEQYKVLSSWRTSGAYLTSGYLVYQGYPEAHKDTRGYHLITKPLDCTEITFDQFKKWVLKEEKAVDMKGIQEECKKRFPIGSIVKNTSKDTIILVNDHTTYQIVKNMIYAHDGHGCLYNNGEYATLISLPVEKSTPPKFKVGDMVIGNDETRYSITKKGWIGTILEFRSSGIEMKVSGDDTTVWVESKYFDLYTEQHKEEVKPTKFKVGDKVRAIDETNGWASVRKGDIGIVKSINEKDYLVDFPTQGWYGKEHCFELVTDDWCVLGTSYDFLKEIKQYLQNKPGGSNPRYNSQTCHYGIENGNVEYNDKSWGKVLTTEEFYAKIGKTPVKSEATMTKEELLAEAKRRYPIGTIVNSLGYTKNKSVPNCEPYWADYSKTQIRFDGDCMVYNNGKWTEIVSKPEEVKSGGFEVGDIITVVGSRSGDCKNLKTKTIKIDFIHKEGYITGYKQYLKDGYFEGGIWLSDLRHATDEEIRDFKAKNYPLTFKEAYSIGYDPYVNDVKPKTNVKNETNLIIPKEDGLIDPFVKKVKSVKKELVEIEEVILF